MPPPEVRELVTRSLAYAQDDLQRRGTAEGPSGPARISCFHAQQAAEKALRVVFVLEQVDFPYTHDLVKLAQALTPGWRLGTSSADLADLNRWAVESRYPMLDKLASADFDRALRAARALVEELTRKIPTGAE